MDREEESRGFSVGQRSGVADSKSGDQPTRTGPGALVRGYRVDGDDPKEDPVQTGKSVRPEGLPGSIGEKGSGRARVERSRSP